MTYVTLQKFWKFENSNNKLNLLYRPLRLATQLCNGGLVSWWTNFLAHVGLSSLLTFKSSVENFLHGLYFAYHSFFRTLYSVTLELLYKYVCRKSKSPWDLVKFIDCETDKGQLISDWIFGVFKSPKKSTKFLTDFCPSIIEQKSIWNLVGFLGDLKIPKIQSEINWPLAFRGLLSYN